jgi:hypothetical protein
MEHFLTADCKSAETPSGAEETYPAGRNKFTYIVCTTLCIIFFTKIVLLRRPAGYVIWHQKGSTSQDGDFKSPKHE